MRTLKIGLCGFTIAIAAYPRRFPVVEVQQTFYQPPADDVVRRWRGAGPGDFEFTIKAWHLITHAAASLIHRRLWRPGGVIAIVLVRAEQALIGAPAATLCLADGSVAADFRLVLISKIRIMFGLWPGSLWPRRGRFSL